MYTLLHVWGSCNILTKKFFIKKVRYIMKKITSLVLALVLFFTFAACSSENTSELKTTPLTGYVLTPGIVCDVDAGVTGDFSYEVIPSYNGNKLSVIAEAENLVKKWWNDDSTFKKPEIVWIRVLSGDIRGFQDLGYLFLDPNTSYEDLLATCVHEWLHELVDPSTLIVLETGWGRPVMEYVVESITIDILTGVVEVVPSSTYTELEDTVLSKHLIQLQNAFRAQKGIEVYEEIFGEDFETILTKIIRENT